MERVGAKQRYSDHQKSFCVNRGKVPGTAADTVKLVQELVKQVGASCTEVIKDIVSVTQHALDTKVTPLSAILKMSRENAASAKSELNEFCAAAQLAS